MSVNTLNTIVESYLEALENTHLDFEYEAEVLYEGSFMGSDEAQTLWMNRYRELQQTRAIFTEEQFVIESQLEQLVKQYGHLFNGIQESTITSTIMSVVPQWSTNKGVVALLHFINTQQLYSEVM